MGRVKTVIKYERVVGGAVLQRRSFRALAPIIFVAFSAAGLYVVTAGLKERDDVAIRMAGVVLIVGAFCVRIARSRIHLRAESVTVVNPLFWHKIPYGSLSRVEVDEGVPGHAYKGRACLR